MKTILVIWGIIATMTGMQTLAQADSDDADLQLLQQQIVALQKRVEALEATKPTFTSLMPNFAERFHVMHLAGESGDWAVANHELLEMKRMAALSGDIDAERGVLMQGMMAPSFEALEEAVEHGNKKKLQAALEQTINTCNACHTATGSPFIKVTLDARDAVSLRHPHAFIASTGGGGHSHGEPKKSTQMMQDMEGMMKSEAEEVEHHDEAGEHKHQD